MNAASQISGSQGSKSPEYKLGPRSLCAILKRRPVLL